MAKERLYLDDYYTYQDLQDMGFGSRPSIIRNIEKGKFPEPIVFNNAHNSPRLWEKSMIDKMYALKVPTNCPFRQKYLKRGLC